MLIMRKIPLDASVNDLTVVRDDERGLLLMFEDCIMESVMNEDHTNEGGFAASVLNLRLWEQLRPELPDFIIERLIKLSIPTYGMIFGHDDFYERFEPDDDEQLPCMKLCKNRIATLENDTRWYWLRNATKKEISSTCFASVNRYGYANYYYAGSAFGVRPIVLIRK